MHYRVRVTLIPSRYPVAGPIPPSIVSFQRWGTKSAPLTFDFANPVPVEAIVNESDYHGLRSRPWFKVERL